MTGPVLFVASDHREAAAWTECWENLHAVSLPVHWARAGSFRGKEMLAVANGVGQERAVAVLNTIQNISAIVSIGTCGALDPSLQVADIVVATSVTDGRNSWPARPLSGARSGFIYSARQIARTHQEKKILRDAGADAVEMEAVGLAEAAYRLDIPFYCVKVVSDVADETLSIDFEEFLMPDGRFHVARLIKHAVMHPFTALPELIRLGKRTNEASRRLAEFLAGCEF